MAAQFPHSEDADPACGFTIGLALLDAGTGKLGAALLHLADDLEEALGVYERTFAPQQPDGIAQARDIRVQRIVPPIPSAAESTGPEEAARIAGAFPGTCAPYTRSPQPTPMPALPPNTRSCASRRLVARPASPGAADLRAAAAPSSSRVHAVLVWAVCAAHAPSASTS